MNEVKLICVLLGIVWRKEEGRSNIEIPSKRLFLRYFPSVGLDWLIIMVGVVWGKLILMPALSEYISSHIHPIYYLGIFFFIPIFRTMQNHLTWLIGLPAGSIYSPCICQHFFLSLSTSLPIFVNISCICKHFFLYLSTFLLVFVKCFLNHLQHVVGRRHWLWWVTGHYFLMEPSSTNSTQPSLPNAGTPELELG